MIGEPFTAAATLGNAVGRRVTQKRRSHLDSFSYFLSKSSRASSTSLDCGMRVFKDNRINLSFNSLSTFVA